jgi:hypothetical protein
MKAILAFNQLKEFLVQCSKVFASKKEQEQNDIDIDTYVVDISEEVYSRELAFDTTEIV